MSKHKEKTPAPLADWDVSLANAEGYAGGWHHFPAARWKRTGKKGCCFYTFTDEQGVVAEFPPGVVLSIIRKEPPVVVHPPGAGMDAVKALGAKLAGPEILPVTPHGGK